MDERTERGDQTKKAHHSAMLLLLPSEICIIIIMHYSYGFYLGRFDPLKVRCELYHFGQDRIGLFKLRGMLAVFEEEQINRRVGSRLDLFDLGQRRILIVAPLDRQR